MNSARTYASLPSPEIHTRQASLETGRVLEVQGGNPACVRLSSNDSFWQAETAASCLLRPQIGDEVLFCPLPDGRAFVLAVLTRQAQPAVLDFPDGARVHAGQPLELCSNTTVRLTGPQTEVRTTQLDLEAARATATVESASLVARIVRSAGQRLEQTFEKLIGRFGSSQRLVREDDETQAGNVRVSASGTSLTQAGNVTQMASDMVRLDAPQVHIS